MSNTEQMLTKKFVKEIIVKLCNFNSALLRRKKDNRLGWKLCNLNF